MKKLLMVVAWLALFILIVILCLLAYLSFSSIGCEEGELYGLSTKYYSAEKRGDWEVAYSMRTPLFKGRYSLKDYSFTMNQDSKDWSFVDFEIGGVRSLFSYAQVDIKTIESPPDDHFLNKQYDYENIEFKGVSKWRCVDKTWYITDPLFRYHFTLNVPKR